MTVSPPASLQPAERLRGAAVRARAALDVEEHDDAARGTA